MKKFMMLLTLSAISTSSFAGYNCNLSLSKNGAQISNKQFDAGDAITVGGHLTDLHTEISIGNIEDNRFKKYERQELHVSGYISGYPTESRGQTATILVYRSHIGINKLTQKFFDYKNNGKNLVEKVTFNGEESQSFEFEDYKLDVTCGFKKELAWGEKE